MNDAKQILDLMRNLAQTPGALVVGHEVEFERPGASVYSGSRHGYQSPRYSPEDLPDSITLPERIESLGVDLEGEAPLNLFEDSDQLEFCPRPKQILEAINRLRRQAGLEELPDTDQMNLTFLGTGHGQMYYWMRSMQPA